jgi:hypothetical protein
MGGAVKHESARRSMTLGVPTEGQWRDLGAGVFWRNRSGAAKFGVIFGIGESGICVLVYRPPGSVGGRPPWRSLLPPPWRRRIRLTRSVDRSPGHAAPSASQVLKCGWARVGSTRRRRRPGRLGFERPGWQRSPVCSCGPMIACRGGRCLYCQRWTSVPVSMSPRITVSASRRRALAVMCRPGIGASLSL